MNDDYFIQNPEFLESIEVNLTKSVILIEDDSISQALVILRKVETKMLNLDNLENSDSENKCKFIKNSTFIKIIITLYNNIACCYQKQKNFQQCIISLKKIIKYYNDYLHTRFNVDNDINFKDMEEFEKKSKSEKLKYLGDFILQIRFSAKYRLQLCAVLSQNDEHKEALRYSKEAYKMCEDNVVKTLKLCELIQNSELNSNTNEKSINFNNLEYNGYREQIAESKKLLLNLKTFINEFNIEKINYKALSNQEINEIIESSSSKISGRNILGIKKQDDWIYHLNIGNIMFISALPLSELDLDSDYKMELLKDAVIEKVVMLTVSLFCVSSEIRLEKPLNNTSNIPNYNFGLSELWHRQALLISSNFLPSTCPIAKHYLTSYLKHYEGYELTNQTLIENEQKIDSSSNLILNKLNKDSFSSSNLKESFKDNNNNSIINNKVNLNSNSNENINSNLHSSIPNPNNILEKKDLSVKKKSKCVLNVNDKLKPINKDSNSSSKTIRSNANSNNYNNSKFQSISRESSIKSIKNNNSKIQNNNFYTITSSSKPITTDSSKNKETKESDNSKISKDKSNTNKTLKNSCSNSSIKFKLATNFNKEINKKNDILKSLVFKPSNIVNKNVNLIKNNDVFKSSNYSVNKNSKEISLTNLCLNSKIGINFKMNTNTDTNTNINVDTKINKNKVDNFFPLNMNKNIPETNSTLNLMNKKNTNFLNNNSNSKFISSKPIKVDNKDNLESNDSNTKILNNKLKESSSKSKPKTQTQSSDLKIKTSKEKNEPKSLKNESEKIVNLNIKLSSKDRDILKSITDNTIKTDSNIILNNFTIINNNINYSKFKSNNSNNNSNTNSTNLISKDLFNKKIENVKNLKKK